MRGVNVDVGYWHLVWPALVALAEECVDAGFCVLSNVDVEECVVEHMIVVPPQGPCPVSI